MNNEVMQQSKAVNERELIAYLDTFTGTAALTESEKRQFIGIAKAYGLNPFKREIYAVAYGEGDKRKCAIITGYEVYLKRAEASGLLKGWKTEFPEKGICRITIDRSDWDTPFIHEVFFEEAVQCTREGIPNQSWSKMPRTMLRKVAIGQGFRLCFPSECGGMPYEEAELGVEVEMEAKNVTLPPSQPEIGKKRQEIWKTLNLKGPDGKLFFSKNYREEKIRQMQGFASLPVEEAERNFEIILTELKSITEENQNGK